MKPVECQFESEVLAAVLQSRWPDRVDEALRSHTAKCAICSDVAAIAGAIDADRDAMRGQAVIPDSGRVWWLAQMRARREATAAAGRPITAVQVIAFASAVALTGACFGATSTWFQSVLAGIRTLAPSATALIAAHGLLVLAAAAIVVLVPAAVYLTMSRD